MVLPRSFSLPIISFFSFSLFSSTLFLRSDARLDHARWEGSRCDAASKSFHALSSSPRASYDSPLLAYTFAHSLSIFREAVQSSTANLCLSSFWCAAALLEKATFRTSAFFGAASIASEYFSMASSKSPFL
uniref:Uncharacterized protein n=1 Tax=Palpitomonas bilix TaxID=652834 RepID=A0A7S3G4H1_9EUKA